MMCLMAFFIALTLHERIKIEVIIFCVQAINTYFLTLFRCIQKPTNTDLKAKKNVSGNMMQL